jgi:hypothetical protein
MQGHSDNSNPIGRVKCIVNTCEYHENGDYCIASAIEIQGQNAGNIDNTDCATFSPRH